MSVVLNGSSQYLDLLNAAASVNSGSLFPYSIHCWMKTSDLAQTTALACFDNWPNAQNMAQFRGSVAGDYVAAACYDGSWNLAISTSGVSNATWHSVLVVFTSTTSRTVYIDGGNKHTDTNTCNSGPGAGGDLGVGARDVGGTPDLFFGGKLAELAIWDIALADADAVSLAGGALANTVEASDLLWYWRLYEDANNDGGTESDNLTERNSPTYDTNDHPVSITTYVDLAAVVAAQSALSAVLAVDTYVGLAAVVAAQSATAAALTVANLPSGSYDTTQTKRRLVAVGNNCVYYEDV